VRLPARRPVGSYPSGSGHNQSGRSGAAPHRRGYLVRPRTRSRSRC